jgi:hypothetical protein
MAETSRAWPPSAFLLAVAGVTLIGAGLYFLLLRPPLLPEDVRYMGLGPEQLAAIRPRLEGWLTHVFRVMGGYVLATGVLATSGVATLVLAVGSFRSLEETRNAYYECYRFADVFATVRRAPKTLLSQIAGLPGVAAVDARIAKLALLDLPDFREPARKAVARPAVGQGGRGALDQRA